MKTHRRIIDFLGLRRSVVALLTMVILVGMGEKLGERFLPDLHPRAWAAPRMSSAC